MVNIALIVAASLLLVAILLLGMSVILAERRKREDSALHHNAIDKLIDTITHLTEENRKANDKVLAAANSTAFQIVKHSENGKSVAQVLNRRAEKWNDV